MVWLGWAASEIEQDADMARMSLDGWKMYLRSGVVWRHTHEQHTAVSTIQSDHHPGICKAHHAHVPQIGLSLTTV